MTYTTIMVDNELKSLLDNLKIHSRESYREVILKLVQEHIEEHKLKEFVNTAQKAKMRELWDNEADEVWANV